MSDAVAVPAGRQLSWGKPITWLPRPLREATSIWKTIVVAWLLAFPASILLAGVVHFIAPNAKGPDFPVTGVTAIFLLVIFSPVLETLIKDEHISVMITMDRDGLVWSDPAIDITSSVISQLVRLAGDQR